MDSQNIGLTLSIQWNAMCNGYTHNGINTFLNTIVNLHKQKLCDDYPMQKKFEQIFQLLHASERELIEFKHLQYAIDRDWIEPEKLTRLDESLYWLSRHHENDTYLDKQKWIQDKIVSMKSTRCSLACISAIPLHIWSDWLTWKGDSLAFVRKIFTILNHRINENHVLPSIPITADRWLEWSPIATDDVLNSVSIYKSPIPITGLYLLSEGDDNRTGLQIQDILVRTEGTNIETLVKQGVILGEMLRQKAWDPKATYNGELFNTEMFNLPEYKEQVEALYSLMPEQTIPKRIFATFIEINRVIQSKDLVNEELHLHTEIIGVST